MSDGPPPAKRTRYDLTLSFDVHVGQQIFPVYHDITTQRSAHLRALRMEQMTNSPDLPVTLDCDPKLFSAYLHSVYFGTEHLRELVAATVEEDAQRAPSDDDSIDEDVKMYGEGVGTYAGGIDRTSNDELASFKDERGEKFLIEVYLLAIKLIDPTTANLVMDELILTIERRSRYLKASLIHFAYKSTTSASPLRRLLRDFSIKDDIDIITNIEYLKPLELPSDYVRDILWEVLRINMSNPDALVRDVYCKKELRPEIYHVVVPDSDDQAVSTIRASDSAEEPFEESVPERPLTRRIQPIYCGPLKGPSSEKPLPRKRPAYSGSLEEPSSEDGSSEDGSSKDPSSEEPRKRGRPANSGTVVLKRPQQANKWWSVAQAKFDNASMSEKYRYTSVANAMESGTVKTPACANCVRRAANGLEDIADCKAVAGGRCGRCLWGRVALTDGCPNQ